MTDWHKRKRLEAAIAGEPTDRVPVALWRHWPGDDQDAQALAAAHLKWQADYDWDLLKIGPASSFAIADWGVEDKWVGSLEGTREYTKRVVTRPSDWAALSPLTPTKGMLATQIEALRLVGKDVGDSVPFIATIFSPLAQAKNLAGEETMLAHMRQDPDSFRRGMETMTETTLRYIEAAKKTGMSGIFYAVQHARYPLLSREEFQTWARPYDLRILESVNDLWCNMVHIHSTDTMFDLTADYPAQFINWHDRETDISLADGLAQIKGAASGGVSRWSLHEESPEKALAEAKEAVGETNDRGLLLGTGCVTMITTPTRNIRALREHATKMMYTKS